MIAGTVGAGVDVLGGGVGVAVGTVAVTAGVAVAVGVGVGVAVPEGNLMRRLVVTQSDRTPFRLRARARRM